MVQSYLQAFIVCAQSKKLTAVQSKKEVKSSATFLRWAINTAFTWAIEAVIVEIHAIIVKQRISLFLFLFLALSLSFSRSFLWLQNFDCINNNFGLFEKRNRNGGEVEKAIESSIAHCLLCFFFVYIFFDVVMCVVWAALPASLSTSTHAPA